MNLILWTIQIDSLGKMEEHKARTIQIWWKWLKWYKPCEECGELVKPKDHQNQHCMCWYCDYTDKYGPGGWCLNSSDENYIN